MKRTIITALLLIAIQLSADAQNSIKRTIQIGKEVYVFAMAWPDSGHHKAKTAPSQPRPVIAQNITVAPKRVAQPAYTEPEKTTNTIVAKPLTMPAAKPATEPTAEVTRVVSATYNKPVSVATKETGYTTAAARIAANTPARQPIPVRPVLSRPVADEPEYRQTTERTPSTIYTSNKEYVKSDSTICFPLTRDRQYNIYDFIIALEDEKIIARYRPYFDKHGLAFSGYVWEAVIQEILADANPEISRYIVLRSESSRVMIKATKHQVIKQFPGYICHIFNNMSKFDSYLGRLDRTRVPKY